MSSQTQCAASLPPIPELVLVLSEITAAEGAPLKIHSNLIITFVRRSSVDARPWEYCSQGLAIGLHNLLISLKCRTGSLMNLRQTLFILGKISVKQKRSEPSSAVTY